MLVENVDIFSAETKRRIFLSTEYFTNYALAVPTFSFRHFNVNYFAEFTAIIVYLN